MEDDIDELPDSDFSKAAARVFDIMDHGKDGFLTFSNFVDFIETLGEGFYSEYLEVHLHKVGPNESGSLDRFTFVRWYVDGEVSLDSAEEAELWLGWDCNVRKPDLQ